MESWAKAFPQNPLPSASIAFFVAGISSIHSHFGWSELFRQQSIKSAKAKSIWLPHLPSIHFRFLQFSLANGRFSLKHHQKRSKNLHHSIFLPLFPLLPFTNNGLFSPRGFHWNPISGGKMKSNKKSRLLQNGNRSSIPATFAPLIGVHQLCQIYLPFSIMN